MLLVWDCGWFDEKDVVFYDVTYAVVSGDWWKLEG
jgi:hypothetical protein